MIAVGQGFMGALLASVFGGLGAAFLGVFLASGAALWVYLARRRVRQN